MSLTETYLRLSYLPPPFFLPSILHPSSLLYPSPVRSRSPNYPTPLRNRYLRFSWKRLPTFLQILRIPRNDYSFSLSPLWKKQRCYLALFIEFKREARKQISESRDESASVSPSPAPSFNSPRLNFNSKLRCNSNSFDSRFPQRKRLPSHKGKADNRRARPVDVAAQQVRGKGFVRSPRKWRGGKKEKGTHRRRNLRHMSHTLSILPIRLNA